MNRKHQKTLIAIFAEPASASLDWSAIESLLLAAGCKIVEGDGSRVRFKHASGAIAIFHRPHPGKEAKRYQVRDAREFLSKIGVEP